VSDQPPFSETPKCKVRLVNTVRLPAMHSAVMPVETGDKEGMLLLEPTSRLVDILCIEDS